MCKLLSLVAITVLFICSSAQADTVLTAILTNGQEPGNIMPTSVSGAPRTSSGQATFVLNDAMTSMTMTVTVLGIDFTGSQSADTNDNLGNAHIHASSDPNFMPPTNAGVVWGFFGSPQNDINPSDVVVTPLVAGVGGTITGKWDAPEGNGTTLAAQLPNILAGRSYINFHTTQFPGGELRGAIAAIPEPGTVTLLACGVFGFGALAIRRRAKTNLKR